MGPLCKWVMPDAIFCVVVWHLLRIFVLFCSCSSEIIQTRKQLWSKVSDTNMSVKRIVFLYYESVCRSDLALNDRQQWRCHNGQTWKVEQVRVEIIIRVRVGVELSLRGSPSYDGVLSKIFLVENCEV